MRYALQTLLAMTCAVPSIPAFAQANGFPARPTRKTEIAKWAKVVKDNGLKVE